MSASAVATQSVAAAAADDVVLPYPHRRDCCYCPVGKKLRVVAEFGAGDVYGVFVEIYA